MSDAGLNFVFTAEDVSLTDLATGAQEQLQALAGQSYDVSVPVSIEGNAADSLSEIDGEANTAMGTLQELGTTATMIETHVSSLADSAADLSDQEKAIGEAATQAAGGIDQLTLSQEASSAAAADQAASADVANTSLTQVSDAANIAGNTTTTAGASMRTLTTVTRLVGKEAGMSSGALRELTNTMRMGAMTSNVMTSDLGQTAGALARLGTVGAIVAGTIAVTVGIFKYNLLGAADTSEGFRVRGTKAFHDVDEALQKVNMSVKKLGEASLVALFPMVGGTILGAKFNMGGLGEETKRTDAVIERLKSSSDKLKTAQDNLRTATLNVTNAERALEDAGMRQANANLSVERSSLNLIQARQREADATQAVRDMEVQGITTGTQYESALNDMKDAHLGNAEAQAQLTGAEREGKRSKQDGKTAIDDLKKTQDDYKKATDDAKSAQDDYNQALLDAKVRASDLQDKIAEWSQSVSASTRDAANSMVDDLARVKQAMDETDPTKRHSPSLVDKVQLGVNQIMSHYQRLSDFTGSGEAMRPAPHLSVIQGGQAPAPAAAPVIELHFSDPTAYLAEHVTVKVDGVAQSAIVRNHSRVAS